MMILAGEFHHLVNFGLRYFIRKHTTDTDPLLVYVQHDLGGGFRSLVEEALLNMHDEFHGRIIVIQL